MVLSRPAPPARSAPAIAPDLDAVLAPKSVAIVGASGDVTRWGGSALQNIIAGGFRGAIYPVNPKGGEFLGLPVSTSLEEVAPPPDLALLAVGAKQLEPVVAECGRAGVRAAVAIAEKGLMRRAIIDKDGDDERKYLARLAETAAEERSPADRLLAEYTGEWRGDIERLFDTHAL